MVDISARLLPHRRSNIEIFARKLVSLVRSLDNRSDMYWASKCLAEYFHAKSKGIVSLSALGALNASTWLRPANRISLIALDTVQVGTSHLDKRSSDATDESLYALNLTVLPLTGCERKVVIWAYCIDLDETCTLQSALMHVGVTQEAAIGYIARLIDEPFEDVRACFTSPSRLHTLRLVDLTFSTPANLMSYFSPLQNLRPVIDALHSARVEELACLLICDKTWFLEPHDGLPPGLLDEWFPPAIAGALRSELAGQPHNAASVRGLIWFVSGWNPPVGSCDSLAGRVDLKAIQTAICRLVLGGSPAIPLTGASVLHAVHAAADNL